MKKQLTIIIALFSIANAQTNSPKQALKSNYEVLYQNPQVADNIASMLQKGEVYGRIRSHTFRLEWERENTSQKDYVLSALGGSLIYQSAIFKNIDFRVGSYFTYADTTLSKGEISYLKAANSAFSRYDYTNKDKQYMAVLGQAYIRYSGVYETEIKLGRQLLETFYTKSNDISMIPNTYDALIIQNKSIPKTALSFSYVTQQKPRGQSEQSAPLVYGDGAYNTGVYPEWSANNDNAMHKGLTYTALRNASKPTDAPLMIAEVKNSSLENTKLSTSIYNVPELLSVAMVEGSYTFKMNDDFSLYPALRYIEQFDDGAGMVGGAAIDGLPNGYKDPNSLDTKMLMGKIGGKYKKLDFHLAYSEVFGEADFVAPWRGFLTSGYTFSLTRVNWMAEQKSYQLGLTLNQNKQALYKDLFVLFYATHTNANESKGHFDEEYYYLGFIQNLPSLPELQWRIRIGYLDTEKKDADTLDTRFELNYLF